MQVKVWLGVGVGAATAILAVGAFGVTVGAAARASPDRAMTSGNFKTPSGNIVCFYLYGSSSVQPHVYCGIKSRLNPAPPRSGSSCKELDYQGDRVDLGNTGRASAIPCSGDAGPYAGESSAWVLGYGKTWSGGGLRCSSALTGLTCRNKSGHGFFLSRERWRRF